MSSKTLQPETKHMTEQEFELWCDEDTRAEYVDGMVVLHSPASQSRERINVFLITLLQLYVDHHRLGTVFGSNFQLRLRPGLRRIPDLAFVSKDRRDIVQETHIEGAPDLVMEVASPDSLVRDWREKYFEYEKAGIREYWIIDPQAKRIDLYHLTEQGGYEVVVPEEGVLYSQVIPGFWLRPEWLWQEPLPNVLEIARQLGISL